LLITATRGHGPHQLREHIVANGVVRRLEQVDGAKQIRGAGQVTLEVPREIFAHAWQTTTRHIQVRKRGCGSGGVLSGFHR
jgi:hypothetical protein